MDISNVILNFDQEIDLIHTKKYIVNEIYQTYKEAHTKIFTCYSRECVNYRDPIIVEIDKNLQEILNNTITIKTKLEVIDMLENLINVMDELLKLFRCLCSKQNNETSTTHREIIKINCADNTST